ncbi:Uncharacterized conserved protein YidB, DUF937 family [Singulisphaera sp. GP187]|uniref:YidB family protein n=1 Tax=Singulisphaera sp. GP187 TaxID=1882752 RepID=UPI000925A14A|nr:YidB family protein [Singulisphaera sp. GP187]SIO41213.1 Uncharacterized conserved protein YidB, DUF937 family [Singulisphaera sp. GP187]
MGLLDSVKSQITDAVQSQLAGFLGGSSKEGEAGSSTAVTDHVAEVVEQQGLGGLLQKFREGGLGDVVSSWVGTGANLPISGEQIQQALGSDLVQNLAAKIGIPTEQAAALLSQILPHAVDTMTPEGRIAEDEVAVVVPEISSPETEETEA